MSIAISLTCADGVVLCADREMANGVFSTYVPKITPISLAPGRCLLLAQAGTSLNIADVADQFKRSAGRVGADVDALRREYQAVLDTVIGKKPKDPHQTLVALPGKITWRSQNTQIAPVLEREASTVIGWGETALASYLLEMFVGDGSRPMLTINQACIVGLYTVLQAKKYVPSCGGTGPTDIMILFPDGRAEECHTDLLRGFEGNLSGVENHLGALLSAVTDTCISDQNIEWQFSVFSDALKQFRQFIPTLSQARSPINS